MTEQFEEYKVKEDKDEDREKEEDEVGGGREGEVEGEGAKSPRVSAVLAPANQALRP